MTCTHVRRWIQLYVDGRLAARHLRALESHLAYCHDCRGELALLELMSAALTEARVEPEPPDLSAVIMARISAVEEQRRRATAVAFAVRWGDAVLAAVLASVVTLIFVLADPMIRNSFPVAFSQSFPGIVALLVAPGPGSIAWTAWFGWVATGLGLAAWLAGSENRSVWRRSIVTHVASLHLSQSR